MTTQDSLESIEFHARYSFYASLTTMIFAAFIAIAVAFAGVEYLRAKSAMASISDELANVSTGLNGIDPGGR